jgi:hypothetical protein
MCCFVTFLSISLVFGFYQKTEVKNVTASVTKLIGFLFSRKPIGFEYLKNRKTEPKFQKKLNAQP